jgi:hypothetical protein
MPERVTQNINYLKSALNRRGQRIEKKRTRLLRRMETAPFVRQQDKVTFVFSIYLLLAFTYFYGRDGDNRYYSFISIVIPCLVASRLRLYYGQGWHYYLLDFCYYASFLSLFVVNYDTKNE